MKKILALILCMLLLLSISGCGKTDGGGEVQTVGNFSVFVPKGMKVVPGDLFDSENPDALTIEKESDSLTYVILSVNDPEWIDSGMESTRELNSDAVFTDCTLSLSNGTFEGFSYESFGTDCLELKCHLSDVYIQVIAAGFKSDDATLKAILESVKVISGSTESGTSGEESGQTADSSSATEVQEMWNGWWYGGLDITGCTGNWEWMNNVTYEAIMYVELDENGAGVLEIYDFGQIFSSDLPECFAEVECHADTSYLYGDSGTSLGVDINTSDWIFARNLSNPDKINMGSSAQMEGGTFGYDLTLMPWGSYWKGEESYTCFIPNFEDYIKRIEDGQIDPFGNYAGGSGEESLEPGTIPGSTSDGSGNAELLGSNPTKLDINNKGIVAVYYPGSQYEYDSDYGKIRDNNGGASILFDPCLGSTNYDEYMTAFTGSDYTSRDDYEIYETSINGYKALVCVSTDWLGSSMDVVVDFGGEHDGYFGLRFAVSGDSVSDCQTDMIWAIIGSFELLK